MTDDYTREEFAEILRDTHKMSGDVSGGIFRLIERDNCAIQIDLNYKTINLWGGNGDVDNCAFQILCDAYRTLERRIYCFYEMPESD